MAADRTPREQSTRATAPIRPYVPPSALPDPKPEPGYGFRWIMTHVLGHAEPTNVGKRLREGWVPVRAEDHPELAYAATANGNVEVGGLMLCKAPEEFIVSRDDYYAKQAAAQSESVNNHFLRQNDARMPLFADTKSSVTRGPSAFK